MYVSYVCVGEACLDRHNGCWNTSPFADVVSRYPHPFLIADVIRLFYLWYIHVCCTSVEYQTRTAFPPQSCPVSFIFFFFFPPLHPSTLCTIVI